MGYNLYVDRKISDGNEYSAFILEGEGYYTQRVYKQPAGGNSKLSYLKTCENAADAIRAMFDYNELPAGDITFLSTHKTLIAYIRFFMNDERAIKPPAEYFDAVYATYTALERMGVCYDIVYADWATRPRAIANEQQYAAQGTSKMERAVDAFKDIKED